ncbi:MAG: autotransporter-associated beta strand repeat-containing protein [Zoogloeaceae bacterium]|nr:autotransporter-associated beta strand repeat-containing protein [Zoogloeaceae bacterium]
MSGNRDAYGAYTDTLSVDATGNAVTVEGNGRVSRTTYGGYSHLGAATGNTVTINGGTVQTVEGGASTAGVVTDNTVTINGGTVLWDIFGGAGTSTAGVVTGNTVTISGGLVSGDVYGGYSVGDTAIGNTVTINGGAVSGDVSGGLSVTGSATGNTVTIDGGTISGDVYGGRCDVGDHASCGDIFTGNTLNLAAGNSIASVQNMATLNFTSAGSAGIGTLDTTPTGSVGSPKVILNTNAYTVDFSGSITGTGGGIEKTGVGTLTLSGANTYGGGTTVSGGTLAGNIAANTNLTVASGATYDGTGAARSVNALNGAGDLINGNGLTVQSGAFSGDISGAGSLTKTGAGTLTLSGANTYTGDTTVSAGGLTVTGTLGGGNYAGAIANDGSLTFNQSGAQTLSGVITGTGTLTKTGAGALSLNENASQSAVALNAGRLNIAADKTLTATSAFTVANNTTLGLTLGGSAPIISADSVSIGNTNTTLDITGYASGTPTIIRSTGSVISGDFTSVTLAGAAQTPSLNTFMDIVTDKISNGSGEDLRIISTLVWNKASDAHGTFNIASGAFDLGANLADNTQFGAGTPFSWDGASLTKTGAGTLILTGANTYTGGTTVSAGTLQIGNGGTTGSVTGDIANNAALSFNRADALTYGGDISGTGSLTKNGAGTLTLSGTNTYSGGTTVSAGGLTVTGTLGGGDYAGAIANSGNLVFNQGGAQTLSGAITGTGTLTKSGVGTLTLSGTNTYTGLTTVQGGTLALSGNGRISDKLALHDGTSFNTGGATFSLFQLDVWGGAAYTGDLNAAGGTLNFYVPSAMGNGATLLTVSGNADIAGSTVNVGIDGASSPLRAGDTLILIDDANTLSGSPLNATTHGQGMQGVTLLYDFDIVAVGNRLLAILPTGLTNGQPIGGPTVNPQTKALSEGFLSGVALLNQGGDLAADKGIHLATQSAFSSTPGLRAFGTISGGKFRYDTGSHVDVEGFSLLTGLAFGKDLTPGRLALGAFFEYGEGDYDTYNSFSNAATVKGNGDTDYKGVGALARFDFTPSSSGQYYAEATARVGRVKNDFQSKDLLDSQGNRAKYDAKSAYYSLHLGVGYVLNLSSNTALDVYSKVFWTRREGDKVTLSTGDPVDFEAVDSQRLRIGARYGKNLNANTRLYAGLAGEQEFDGKAKAKTHGYAIKAPDLKGFTTIGEFGLTLTPAQNKALTLDVGLQGYAGKREGVTGTARVNYAF